MLEALAAAVLLVVLATGFWPAAPGAPTPAQRWADVASPHIVALARDITDLQGSLPPPRAAPSAPGPVGSQLARLRRDLRRAGRVPAPPGAGLQRIWSSALGRATDAVDILAGAGTGASLAPARLATARADLDAAGQALVAASATARSPGRFYPH